MISSIIIAITSIAIVVLLRIYEMLSTRKRQKEWQEYFSDIGFMDSKISHNKYKRIARRSSVSNTPAREAGDYFDFLFKYIADSDVNDIENSICYTNMGEG